MRRFKSKAFCEGEKMNPSTPGQTLSICMPKSLKVEIVEYTQKQEVSIASWVRKVLRKEMGKC
tara:strand:- start:342 stop:530 length:189 start_codon:yes stop_codon:yes gene_type:complete